MPDARGAGGRPRPSYRRGHRTVADELHPLQQAFHEHHGLQCGFCTPGILDDADRVPARQSDPTEQEVRIAISGNLCRCTGYQNIVIATLDAAKRLGPAGKLVGVARHGRRRGVTTSWPSVSTISATGSRRFASARG